MKRSYNFALILDREITDQLAEDLYEACDDATAATSNGVPVVDFTREAASLEAALASAMRDVRSVGFAVKSITVHPEELETIPSPTV